MEENVTKEQIKIMHKFSVITFIFLGIMIIFVFIFNNYITIKENYSMFFISLPLVLSLLTIAYMGIRYKVIGSIGLKYPTYYGKRAQIVGYIFIGLSIFILIYLNLI